MAFLRHSCAVLATFASIALAANAAPPQYQVTPIDRPAGELLNTGDFNNRGELVGSSIRPAEQPVRPRAFLYTPAGGFQYLPVLPGFEDESYAGGINDAGDVVGTAARVELLPGTIPPTYRQTERGFLYRNGTMTNLAGENPPNLHRAWDISNGGQIVGDSGAGQEGTAWTRTGDTVTTLPQFNGTWTQARLVNDAGDIVGEGLEVGRNHTFVYRNGAFTELQPFAGNVVSASDLNDVGQIVGTSSHASGESRAFLYSGGQMIDLLAPAGINTYSNAHGINEAGHVVGQMGTGANFGWRAFLYENGTVTDLNTLVQLEPGWTLISADAINDVGQIVGTLQNPQGVTRLAILTPVPEPGGVALLVAAAPALLLLRRRGRC